MNLYLFGGDDAFAIRQAEEAMIEKWVDPEWRSFNLVMLEDATAEQLSQAVLTPSFAPGDRLVIVRDCSAFKSRSKEEGDEETGSERDSLLSMLESLTLPKETQLIFSGPSGINKNTKLYKWCQKHGEVSDFSIPDPTKLKFEQIAQLAGWAEAEVAQRGGRIEREAAEAIIQASGGNRGIAAQEIEKLLTYSEVITLSEVEVMGSGESGHIFMLTGAIANRDPSKAIGLMRKLLLTDNSLRILATIATTIRNWLSVKVLSTTHKSSMAISQALGLKNDYRVKRDLEVCRKWKLEQLKKAVAVVLEADLALKQTGLSEQFVLERMILKISAL